MSSRLRIVLPRMFLFANSSDMNYIQEIINKMLLRKVLLMILFVDKHLPFFRRDYWVSGPLVSALITFFFNLIHRHIFCWPILFYISKIVLFPSKKILN